MNCLVDYDGDVKRRLTHPLIMSKYETDTGVVNLVKNTMQKAVVNCGVSKKEKVCKSSLGKGSTRLPSQRAKKKLDCYH